MNVIEIADKVSEKFGLAKKQAKDIVEAVFEAVTESATKAEEVSIPGFGKFKVTAREARTGRNPATGATIQIAASKKLGFSPAKQVKDKLNPPAPVAAKAKPKAKK